METGPGSGRIGGKGLPTVPPGRRSKGRLNFILCDIPLSETLPVNREMTFLLVDLQDTRCFRLLVF